MEGGQLLTKNRDIKIVVRAVASDAGQPADVNISADFRRTDRITTPSHENLLDMTNRTGLESFLNSLSMWVMFPSGCCHLGLCSLRGHAPNNADHLTARSI